MRRSMSMLLATGFSVLVLSAGGCASPQPVSKFGLNRDTPGNAYEYFKAAAAANQWAAEWSLFSPNAKRQIDQLAGRHVDLGDYSTARQSPIGNNSTAEMQSLLQSQLVGVQQISDTAANVTLSGGGRTVSVRMVRLTSWELKEKGVEEPLGGFLRSPGDAVVPNADGSITVRIQPQDSTATAVRTITRDRIDGFAVKSMWYVDDLASLQGAVSGVGSQPARGQPAQPTPGPAPAPAPADPSMGSPD
jgi:hypothetical protein